MSAGNAAIAAGRRRPRIAFFDYADVFEDFYPHYGVDQRAFVSTWAATSSHAFLALLQREVGDVRWVEPSLRPTESRPVRHELGFEVQIVPSSLAHRALWNAFYRPPFAWRWRATRAYVPYATVASYAAPLSRGVWRALRSWPPDVLFAQDYSSGKFDVLLGLARRLGVPLVAYNAGGTPEGWLGASLRRRTLSHADLLIASSAAEEALLVGRFGVDPERVEVILTPIDTDRYRPLPRSEACRAAGLDPARRYVLFVGRLSDREKRVGPLIDSFAAASRHRPGMELLIVGEGPDGAELRRRAAEVGDRVRFLGWISSAEELAPLYAAADCLALPSCREGFPTVVGEAMACGTPVLGSRVGGIPELVVEGETGWLLPPGDDHALLERLTHVLAHPEEALSMRGAARRLAEARVSPAVVGNRLKESFSRVLARV